MRLTFLIPEVGPLQTPTAVLQAPADVVDAVSIRRDASVSWLPAATKRLLDIVLALLAIIVLAIPMVFIAAALVLSDFGPVFFRQVRAGRHGRPFKIMKFRTMVVDAEERLRRDPELLARYLAGNNKLDPSEDVRITRLGRLLRATSLDELPQLFNVLAGSMSLVGPRPVLFTELRHYGERTPRVLAVRPGMTGPWQVSGRSSLGRTQRVLLDDGYASQWTIGGDLRILAKTVVAVLSRNGAY